MYGFKSFSFSYLILILALAGYLTSCNISDRNNQAHLLEIELSKSLSQRAENYLDAHPDTAIIFADSALKLANWASPDYDAIYQLYQIKANAWQNLEQPDSAILYLQKKYDLSLAAGDSAMQAHSLFRLLRLQIQEHAIANPGEQIDRLAELFHRLGMEYYRAKAISLYDDWCNKTGDIALAQKYLVQACEIYEKLDSTQALIAVYLNVGNNFKQIGSKPEALKYYKKSADIASRRFDTLNMAKAMINSGTIYRSLNPDSAMKCYEAVDALLAETHYSYYKTVNSFNLANIYSDQKNYTKAKQMFEQVMRLSRESNNIEGIVYAHNGLASIYSKTGKTDLAVENMQASVKIAKSLNNQNLILILQKQLYATFKEAGRWEEAITTIDEINMLNDSLMSLEKQVSIHALEIKYQGAKKALENATLKEQVNIQELNLSNRKLVIVILTITTLILVVLLWYAYRLYRQRGFAYQALLARFKAEMHLPLPAKNDSASETDDPDNDSRQLMKKLQHYFQTEKPYLDHKLKVDEVAEKLDTNRKTVANALKFHEHHNFNSFCNLYRVEEAKKLIVSPGMENFTLEAIGDKSGFGSRQNFYAVFQQFTGMRPAFFREQMLTKNETSTG